MQGRIATQSRRTHAAPQKLALTAKAGIHKAKGNVEKVGAGKARQGRSAKKAEGSSPCAVGESAAYNAEATLDDDDNDELDDLDDAESNELTAAVFKDASTGKAAIKAPVPKTPRTMTTTPAKASVPTSVSDSTDEEAAGEKQPQTIKTAREPNAALKIYHSDHYPVYNPATDANLEAVPGPFKTFSAYDQYKLFCGR